MSDATHQLLIELGTEELPPKSLKQLSDSFSQNIADELSKLGFAFDHFESFGAPRRLGILVHSIARHLPDEIQEKRGPAINVAFDEHGEATKAALGWAKGNGISIDQAERLITDKGEWLLHKAKVSGKSLDSEINGVLARAIKRLPIPKPMRWGSSDAEFIRPAHTLTVLLDDQVIAAQALDINADRMLSGHRFHGQQRVSLAHANQYRELMKAEYVLVDYASRTEAIRQQLESKAKALGLHADYDQSLLEEISSLVEWPVILQAEFEEEFLEVPKEALIYTMKDDQKYVPLLNDDGSLSAKFLFVSNIESKDPTQIIEGNEKVIRPRLSDARFFFNSDRKTSLLDKSKKLTEILFQKQLGSIADKCKRLELIVNILGKALDVKEIHIAQAQRAAMLAKADLVSNMVMEFPSVQGTMGRHYALYDGEEAEVAQAIEEQYLPRFANDRLPECEAGVLLSLAEKLDTLVGIFGINKLPKGDKDPFALRRAAIGILRIMLDQGFDVSLHTLVKQVVLIFGDKLTNSNTTEQVSAFLLDRCKPFYAEQGISADVLNAAMQAHVEITLSDLDQRIHAVAAFAKSSAGPDLIAANKRVSNILNKNDIQLVGQQIVDSALLLEPAEKDLYDAIVDITKEFALERRDYASTLTSLSHLQAPLAAFFDSVMIMAEDEAVKFNRIKLVSNVRHLFLSVADISLINV